MLRYLAADRLAGVPHVTVDGSAHAGSVLVLSQQPGSAAPAHLRADTCAELALNFLRWPDRERLLDGVEVVTSAQFDLDRLLALWALLEPEAALARADAVAEAARAGAFHRYHDDWAAQLACLARGAAAWQQTPAGRPLLGLAPAAHAAALYEDLLPLTGAMLDDVRRFDGYWFVEYADVIRSNALRHSGAVQVEEYPELDLAVLETPLDLHDLTRLSCSELPRLLTVRSENTYTLEYRAESWVQYHSRRVLPRIDLAPLAARLNLFERFPGRWRAQPLDQPVARLFLDNGAGPAPSSLDRETLLAEVLDYLRANAGNSARHWSPYPAA